MPGVSELDINIPITIVLEQPIAIQQVKIGFITHTDKREHHHFFQNKHQNLQLIMMRIIT